MKHNETIANWAFHTYLMLKKSRGTLADSMPDPDMDLAYETAKGFYVFIEKKIDEAFAKVEEK